MYQPFIKDANGCTVAQAVRLTALPSPVVFLGNDTTLCTGSELLLVAPASVNYQYRWQDNTTGNASLVTQAGSYYVSVTNQYQCATSDTINIRYRPVPVFSLGSDTAICSNQSLHLQPAVMPGHYLWSTGSQSAAVTIAQAGNYWLQVNNGGCVYADSIRVDAKPTPTVNFGQDTILCAGQTLLLNATNSNASYSWQDGSSLPVLSVSRPGTYAVTVNEGGCYATGSITIGYTTIPLLQLVRDTTLCITEKLLLDASFPQSAYLWQDGSVQPGFTVVQPGLYTVRVTNHCGVRTDSIAVKYEPCDCHIYVPNAFTANHDGRNDLFRPVLQCLYSSYLLQVFNRFGQLIFSSADPAHGWNGKYKGTDQPVGGYVWMLQYADKPTGKRFRQKGMVLLLR